MTDIQLHEFSSLKSAVMEISNSLLELIKNSREKTIIIEQQLLKNPSSGLSGMSKNLSTARRIIQALELRLEQMNVHIKESSLDSLKLAYNLSLSRLSMSNDTINKLITEEDLRPIEANKITSTIDFLLNNILVEKKLKRVSLF